MAAVPLCSMRVDNNIILLAWLYCGCCCFACVSAKASSSLSFMVGVSIGVFIKKEYGFDRYSDGYLRACL